MRPTRRLFLNSALRLTGLGLQFVLLFAVYALIPSVVDLYIRSLFLSTIGMSVARAGANFATLRESDPIDGRLAGGFASATVRTMLGIAAIVAATLFQPAYQMPYAAFLGVLFGIAHNVIYRRFLTGKGAGGVVFAFFGVAHFAGVLSLLLVSSGAQIALTTTAAIAMVGVAAIAFASTLRSKMALTIGELSYSYAYPLCIYVASSVFSGAALWFYFVLAKAIDAVSILFSFNFQPRFYTASPEVRWHMQQRVKYFFDRAFVAMLVAVGLAAVAVWHLRLDREEIGWAAIQASAIAFSFFLCGIGAFIFVCVAQRDLDVLAYGVAVSLLPVFLWFAFSAIASTMIGCVAAVLAVWLINHISAWHRVASRPWRAVSK
jgi:hypothetical protein